MILRNALCALLFGFTVAGGVVAAESGNIFGIKIPQSMEEMFLIVHEDADAKIKFRNAYSSFFYQDIQHYDAPGLGYSVYYATTNGTTITVYVYDNGLSDIPNGVNSMAVDDELTSATRAIVSSNQYRTVEQQRSSEALSEYFAQAYHMLVNGAGQRVKSYTLLRGQNDHFIKVRITGPDQRIEPSLAAFLENLVEDLGITVEV